MLKYLVAVTLISLFVFYGYKDDYHRSPAKSKKWIIGITLFLITVIVFFIYVFSQLNQAFDN